MSNETNLTIRGRLVADPELRWTPSGSGVANFTLASQASKFDKDSNSWKDKPTKFWRCAAWNQGKLTRAENIANMLKKGDSIIVYGELETREYTNKEGENKVAEEVRVESIGKDLTFHGQAYANDAPTQESGGGFASQPAVQEDPWATPGVSNAGGWGSGPSSEPPF